jgi:hypothetical protein
MHCSPIKLAKWNNRHVTVVGTLVRFGSALVHPPIFIEISTIKQDSFEATQTVALKGIEMGD